MKIKISTDSTCDLPAELIAAHDIGVQPLYIIRAGEALRDGIDVTPDDLYAYTKETGKLCGTSAVTITDYLGSWKAWLEEYDAIVHVAFSSELSASCNNARLAAMELPGKVWVVDSLNLSTGFGHLVLDAALQLPAELPMPPYLHVLGARKTALPRLKQATLPAGTALADLVRSSAEAGKIGRLHSKATDFSSLCREKIQPMGLAFTAKAVVI